MIMISERRFRVTTAFLRNGVSTIKVFRESSGTRSLLLLSVSVSVSVSVSDLFIYFILLKPHTKDRVWFTFFFFEVSQCEKSKMV